MEWLRLRMLAHARMPRWTVPFDGCCVAVRLTILVISSAVVYDSMLLLRRDRDIQMEVRMLEHIGSTRRYRDKP